jgi:hypothetical protein
MNLLTFLYREGKGMSKFRSILIALAACAAVMTAAVPPSEADTNTTVRFRSGGDSASYTGRIRGDETARYVLDARRGQTMQVLLSAGNPQAYFNVVLPDSQEALFNGATSGNSFSGKLPQNGRYVIEVYLTRAAARRNEESSYSIDIAIPASSGGKAPAEDFADGDAGGPDNWIVTGIAPNDKLNVRSAPSAGAEVVGRLRNGVVVRNLGCRTISGSRWCRISARGESGVHGWTNGRFLTESGGGGNDRGYAPQVSDDGQIRDTKCKASPQDCIRKAENKCNGSFRTIHSESHAGGALDDKLPGPVTWYYLEYQCGHSDGRYPQFPFRGAHYQQEYDQYDDLGSDGNYGGYNNRRDDSSMRDTCRSAAAKAFGQRTRNVVVLPAERLDDGYAVYGQFPEYGPNATQFRCKFNELGVFRRVRRE